MINKEPWYLKYWDLNISYGREISKNLLVNDFTWVEDISEFNEEFIKIYHDDSDKRYFLETDVQYPENLRNLQNNLSFLPEKMEMEKAEILVVNLHDKT